MIHRPTLRIVLLAMIVMLCIGESRAQEDDGAWQSYFNMLVEQYEAQTGDSIFGSISSDSPETRANLLFESEKYPEAIPHFDKLIARWPTGWNYFRRGFCHYMSKSYQLAIADFTKCIARFPEPMLGPWWVGPRVSDSSDDGKYSKRQHISLVYQYIDAYFYRAESKLLIEDYYGCIADVHDYFARMDTSALRFPQMEGSALRMTGHSKFTLGDRKGAIEDFQGAIEANPDDGLSYFDLGVALLKDNQIPQGCLSLSRAGELGFKDAYALIKEHCGSR